MRSLTIQDLLIGELKEKIFGQDLEITHIKQQLQDMFIALKAVEEAEAVRKAVEEAEAVRKAIEEAEAVRKAKRQGEADRGSIAAVENGNKRIQVIDATTYETIRTVALGGGTWCGLSVHRREPEVQSSSIIAVSDCSGKVRLMDGSFNTVKEISGDLDRPFFLTFYSLGSALSLLVSNQGKHRIDVFDCVSGSRTRIIGQGCGSGPEQLQCPGGIDVWRPDEEDPTSHQLIVADRDNHRLQFFSLATGRFMRTIGQSGSGVGQIQQPWALKITKTTRPQEALLVTIGCYDSRVHIFTMVSGVYLRCLGGGKGAGIDQLNSNVCGIAFHREADSASETDTEIIISDRLNHRLQVFNLYSGVHVRSVGSEGKGSGQFSQPCCINMI